MSIKRQTPSLETLVNQCCEEYYSSLNADSVDGITETTPDTHPAASSSSTDQNYYTTSQFKKFVKDAHCQENLDFLVEIFHYEKIWNRVFKRQSSILKCKDESLQQQRKLSVATVFTNSSSLRQRNQSIAEDLETSNDVSVNEENHDGSALLNQESPISPKIDIPSVVNGDDFDTRSFVNEDFVPDGPACRLPVAKNREVWDSLFKSSYCDEVQKTHGDCLCNDSLHSHTTDSITCADDGHEYNESVKQLEARENLKNELTEKFTSIINTYVSKNSLKEINLPCDVYSDLIRVINNKKILYHSPLTLVPAKNAILQLLRENIYYKFTSEQEKLKQQNEQKSSHICRVTDDETVDYIDAGSMYAAANSTETSTIRSASSVESLKKITSPINTLSNFLNKYHLKVHSGASTPSITSIDPRPEHSSPSDSSHSVSLTNVSSANSVNSTTSDSKNLLQKLQIHKSNHHPPHAGSTMYIRAPCGIIPTESSFNPMHPSGSEKWGSRFLKFKRKKKSVSSINTPHSTTTSSE